MATLKKKDQKRIKEEIHKYSIVDITLDEYFKDESKIVYKRYPLLKSEQSE